MATPICEGVIEEGLRLGEIHGAREGMRMWSWLVEAGARCPFDLCWAPVAAAAMHRIESQPRGYPLERAVMASRAHELLRDLSELSQRRLCLELEVERAQHDRLAAARPEATGLHDRLSDRLMRGQLQTLMREAPRLRRVLSCQILAWLHETSEVLRRVDEDLTELSRWLGRPGEVSVTALRNGSCDPHDGGKRPVVVEFDGVAHVVYKPRSLEAEQLVVDIAKLAGLAVRVPEMLCRDGWGWSLWVKSEACHDRAEVSQHYERAGELIAVASVLGLGDLHGENIVANGPWPVIVDAEVILHAPLVEGDIDDPCVLDSLLLPRWDTVESGASWDGSGLGQAPNNPIPVPAWQVEHVGSDAMRVRLSASQVVTTKNRPVYRGQTADPVDFERELLHGYERGVARIAEARDKVRVRLERATEAETRYILRPTGAYALMRDELVEGFGGPEAPGIERRIEARLDAALPVSLLALRRGELEALAAGWIPRITSTGGDTSLRCGSHVAADALSRSGIAAAVDRLRCLTHAPPALIGLALRARRELIAGTDMCNTRTHSVSSFDLDGFAEAVGRLCISEGPTDTREAWWGACRDARSGAVTLDRLGPDLHSGAAGIGVLLAGLAATGHGGFADHARLAARRAVLQLGRKGPHAAARLGPGAFDGVGSVLYAVALIGALLQDAGTTELVGPVLKQLDDALDLSRESDVQGGAAGALLAALAGMRTAFRSEAIAVAHRCAASIGDSARHERSDSGDGVAWLSLDETALTGMAHGASGIAMALARFAADTGEEEYRELAIRGIEWEDTHRNGCGWTDLRQGATGEDLGAWCSGSAGIGLASLAIGEALGIDVTERVERAAEVVSSRVALETDAAVCCGNSGRVEFLRAAGEALERQDLAEEGEARAIAMLDNGWPACECAAYDPYDRSFMRGTPGVAWTCLRICYPGFLPSVLTLEMPC